MVSWEVWYVGNITKEAMFWMPHGKRKQGRPRETGEGKLNSEKLASAHLSWSEVQNVASMLGGTCNGLASIQREYKHFYSLALTSPDQCK